MATWKYTKKLTLDYKSAKGRQAHESAYLDVNAYQDWYYEQIDAGLADGRGPYVPFKLVSDTVYEIIVTDQSQADSYVAMVDALGDRLGFPIAGYSVTDVDYTAETIPVDFTVMFP